MPLDTIILRHLHTTATIGPDAWNRPGKPQPIILTLKLRVDTAPAGNSDDIGQTFSYGQMCKDIAQVSNGFYLSIDNLTRHLLKITDDHGWPGEGLEISALAPKALLRVEGGLQRELVLQRTYEEEEWQIERHVWLVKDLKVACIIGVNPHERLEKQQVNINLRVTVDGDQNDQAQHILKDSGVWRKLVNKVCEVSNCYRCR